MENAAEILEDVEYFEDPYQCARDADAVVVVTEWESICRLDLTRLKRVMRSPILIDLRNAFSRDAAHTAGFQVTGIGLPAFQAAPRELAGTTDRPAARRDMNPAQPNKRPAQIIRLFNERVS
jgi:UDPglucose 6-dehydrogenase